MNESQLTAKVKKMIRQEFPDVWFQKLSDRFTSGILDLHLCCWGVFVAMEGKTPQNKKRDKLQEFNILQIRRAGGIAGIYRNVEDARQMILEARKKALDSARG
jgi:hypothetical protein